MNKKLMHVPFQGEDVLIVKHEGQPYVPAKHICDNLGVAWQNQHLKLNKAPERWGVIMMMIPSIGGGQQTLCLPLRKVPAWLMTIGLSKVRAEVRPKLQAYQNECDGVLWNYWMEGRAENPRLAQNGHGQNGHGQNWHAFDKKHALSLPGRPPFMLAKALAEVYGVSTKQIAQAVRRHPVHFPEDFVFEMTGEEKENLQNGGSLSHQATLSTVRGFTRNGANMLAALLTSKAAAQHRMQIMHGLGDWEEVAQNGHASDKKHAQTIYSDEPVMVLAMSEWEEVQAKQLALTERVVELLDFKMSTLENAGGMPNERLV